MRLQITHQWCPQKAWGNIFKHYCGLCFGITLKISKRDLKCSVRSKRDLECCLFSATMTTIGEAGSDIDGQELAQEILNLPQLPPLKTALEMLAFLHDSHLQELYTNLCIALQLCTQLWHSLWLLPLLSEVFLKWSSSKHSCTQVWHKSTWVVCQ